MLSLVQTFITIPNQFGWRVEMATVKLLRLYTLAERILCIDRSAWGVRNEKLTPCVHKLKRLNVHWAHLCRDQFWHCFVALCLIVCLHVSAKAKSCITACLCAKNAKFIKIMKNVKKEKKNGHWILASAKVATHTDFPSINSNEVFASRKTNRKQIICSAHNSYLSLCAVDFVAWACVALDSCVCESRTPQSLPERARLRCTST